MTTPTPINTFEDILAAMDNNPELRTALRQHVLDQEFLQLPAIVRELQSATAELQRNVAELQQTVAELAQLVHDYIIATNTRLDRLESKVDRLEGNMNRLIGSDYERKAARRAPRLAQRRLGLTGLRVIYAITAPDDNSLPELLDHAIDEARINADEADELENADVILSGTDRYVVAEVSLTLDKNDVERSSDRAGIISRATAIPVSAIAIGAYALDDAVRSAAANDVSIILLDE